jgi:4-amino-4-deoxy-L-arabinose transferase-like glycosyltransferase
MTKKREIIILLIVILIGVFLRFYQFGSNPASLYWDEAAIALDAYSIGEHGQDIHGLPYLQAILASYGDFKAPILIYLASLSVKIFGMSALAIRLPVALFSVLSIYLVYLLAKELLNFNEVLAKRYKLMPLLAALMVSISPWSVHFGRIAFESSLSVAFLLLALLFFLKAVNKRSGYFLISTLFAVLATYTYYSLRAIIPLFFLALLITFFKEIKHQKVWLILAMSLFVFLIIPIFRSPYYEASQAYRLNNNNLIHPTQAIAESSQYLEKYHSSFFAKIFYHRYLFMARDFLINMSTHFDPQFLFLKGDSNLRQHSGYLGEFFLVTLPFYVWGIFLLFKNLRSKLAWFLLFFMILAPIPASLVYEVPHASRAIYLFVPFSILIAWGLNEAYLLKNKIFLSLVLPLIVINALIYYSDYFNHYVKRSSQAWLYSYNQLAIYLKDHYQEYSDIEISEYYWFPDIFIYYHFPELLNKRKHKQDLALENPLPLLLDTNAKTKKKAKFIYYKDEVPKGFMFIKNFDFLNGEPSLVLVVQEDNL